MAAPSNSLWHLLNRLRVVAGVWAWASLSAVATAQAVPQVPIQDPPAPSATASDTTSSNGGSFYAGYDDGFVIRGDGNLPAGSQEDIPFQLRINGWGQLRITNFQSTGPNNDLNQFQLVRARLVFSGHAFTPDFSYFIQMDGRSTSGDDVRLLDYFLSFDLGRHWWGLESKSFVLKTGKYKIPSTLARYSSGKEWQFTDNSVASTYFDANRSLAVGLFGETRPGGRPASWEVAMFNGLVTGGAETGSSGQIDNNFGYSARVMAYPYGDWGPDDISDYEFHETPATRVGAAFVSSRINREGSTEYNTIRTVDSGELLADLLPAAAQEYLVCIYSVDASLKYRGFSWTCEYYFRNINDFVAIEQSDLFDHGFWLQVGYYLVPQKFEILGRWSRVVGESGTLGAWQQSSDEKAVGFTWYFRHHNGKLTVDGTWLNGAPIDSPTLDIRPGDAGFLARTQIQFSF